MTHTTARCRIELGEPVTVAIAPPEIQGWGPYQFPGLARLPDGRIQLSFHVELDSATAYGLPQARAISADDGKTWTMVGQNTAQTGAALTWAPPLLHLPNGDWLTVKQLRSIPASDVALPEQPVGLARNYRNLHPCYRLEDVPVECASGWKLFRLPAGRTEWVEQQASVRMPGEVRRVAEGMLVLPWFHEMFLAPDGAVWAVNYNCRIADGALQELFTVAILRSTDGGMTFDLWSEIPYAPNPAVDPLHALRDGFSEPTVAFLPDGSVLCLMRTTDGEGVGPLYWSRSTDNGVSWSAPAVFDDLGVWPQLLALSNGVTLAAYGRPGLYVRATDDPSGMQWDDRVAVLPPEHGTCAYASFLALGDNRALLAYSNSDLHDAAGRRCKGVQVREIVVAG